MKDFIWLGKIINTHALKGEMKISSNSDFKDDRFQVGNSLFYEIRGEVKEVVIASVRNQKDLKLIKFEGLNDIDEVMFLKGRKVYIKREDAVMPENMVLLIDLIGYEVRDENDNILGEITDVVDLGPYKSVTVSNGENIPLVDQFVLEQNNESKYIKVVRIEVV